MNGIGETLESLEYGLNIEYALRDEYPHNNEAKVKGVDVVLIGGSNLTRDMVLNYLKLVITRVLRKKEELNAGKINSFIEKKRFENIGKSVSDYVSVCHFNFMEDQNYVNCYKEDLGFKNINRCKEEKSKKDLDLEKMVKLIEYVLEIIKNIIKFNDGGFAYSLFKDRYIAIDKANFIEKVKGNKKIKFVLDEKEILKRLYKLPIEEKIKNEFKKFQYEVENSLEILVYKVLPYSYLRGNYFSNRYGEEKKKSH